MFNVYQGMACQARHDKRNNVGINLQNSDDKIIDLPCLSQALFLESFTTIYFGRSSDLLCFALPSHPFTGQWLEYCAKLYLIFNFQFSIFN
jgi:hypothetical protein